MIKPPDEIAVSAKLATRLYRFRNPGEEPMVVWVDLWNTEYVVPSGSVLTVHCYHEHFHGTPTIQPVEGGLQFWAECDGYSADIDGREIFP